MHQLVQMFCILYKFSHKISVYCFLILNNAILILGMLQEHFLQYIFFKYSTAEQLDSGYIIQQQRIGQTWYFELLNGEDCSPKHPGMAIKCISLPLRLVECGVLSSFQFSPPVLVLVRLATPMYQHQHKQCPSGFHIVN